MINKKRINVLAAGLIICALVLGCVPRALNPLPHDANDTRLLGNWIGESDGETIRAEVTELSGDRLRIFTISLDENGEPSDEDPFIVHAWTTRLSNGDYLTARVIEDEIIDEDDDPGFVICRYMFTEDGQVAISFMAEEAIIADIENGIIGGSVTIGQWFNEIVLDASPTALAAYLEAADSSNLFAPPFATFRRADG